MLCYADSSLTHLVFTVALDCTISSLCLNLILFCTVTFVQSCSLGVISYTIQVCVSMHYDVHMRMKLPEDTFLRTYPVVKWHMTVVLHTRAALTLTLNCTGLPAFLLYPTLNLSSSIL